MSIVIIGGNECMVRQYTNLCREYGCRAKTFPKMSGSMKNKIGSPDLLVLFTGTMSHKMLRSALCETKGAGTKVARSHSSSIAALKTILDKHIRREETVCPINC